MGWRGGKGPDWTSQVGAGLSPCDALILRTPGTAHRSRSGIERRRFTARLIVHILDQGPGFNLADVPDPLLEENLLKTSGRGIFLMRTFMDRSEEHTSELQSL